jgi:hypothetical protein
VPLSSQLDDGTSEQVPLHSHLINVSQVGGDVRSVEKGEAR